MKRVMRFLVRLYPSSWRNRYGVEFNALLEEPTLTAGDTFDIFWGALKMQMTPWGLGRVTFLCSVAGILVAAAVSFMVPVHYESQAIFTAAPADETTRRVLSSVEQSVVSRESLASVIKEHNLYSRERTHLAFEEVIDEMKRNIHVYPAPVASSGKQDSLKFVVQFDYSDGRVAQQANEDLAGRFIKGNFEMAPRLNSHTTLQLPELPSLPLRPASPDRTQFSVVGLLVGLLTGLTFAILLGLRRTASVGHA
jgi:capsular polysaccharide biosynthesis protein